jgi:hypothetical protein
VKISGAGISLDPSHMIPPPSTCSDCSATYPSEASVVSSENSTKYTDSDTRSDIDESELGEFLMDTFEGLDTFGVGVTDFLN